MSFPLLFPLEKNESLIHKTLLTQELSCVKGLQRRKNVIEHWTVIRENCREDEDYRPVGEDGKKDLNGNTRPQRKLRHMKKGENQPWQMGEHSKCIVACEHFTMVQVVEFLVISSP